MMNFWSNDAAIPIQLNGQDIPQVTSTKFLGVHLDQSLSWNNHISQLHNKLTANKYLLRANKSLLTTKVL